MPPTFAVAPYFMFIDNYLIGYGVNVAVGVCVGPMVGVTVLVGVGILIRTPAKVGVGVGVFTSGVLVKVFVGI